MLGHPFNYLKHFYLGLPDFPRRNTGDFCLSIHPNPVRPMCRYIYSVHVAIRTQIPHKQWTLLKFYRPKIESNPSLCSASLIRMSTWRCPHLLLSAVLRTRATALLLPGARRCRSISFARTALSSKPAAAFDWWDRLTGGQTPTSYARLAVKDALRAAEN